jgi:flagellar biogenesis protein FliO
VNSGGRAIRNTVRRRIGWFVASLVISSILSPFIQIAVAADPPANHALVANAPAAVPARITPTYDNVPVRSAVASHTASAKSTEDSTDGDGSSMEVPRIVCATALVVGLIFLLRWVGRRFGGAPTAVGTRAVQVVSRSLIAPRQSVVLVRIGKRLLVVADNGSQLSPLSEISDPDEVAALVGQVQSEKIDIAGRTFGAFFGRFKRDEKDELVASEPVETLAEGIEPSHTDGSDVSAARAQLSGLMEQVRLVSSQFDRS